MKRFALTALVVLMLAMLPACSMKDAVKRMSFELKKVHVTGMDDKGFNATLSVQVNNPNLFAISVTDFKYTAYLGDRELAAGSLDEEFTVPADGSAVAELPIVVTYGEMKGGMFGLLSGRLDYRVTGEAGFRTWLGRYALPFDTGDKSFDMPGRKHQGGEGEI